MSDSRNISIEMDSFRDVDLMKNAINVAIRDSKFEIPVGMSLQDKIGAKVVPKTLFDAYSIFNKEFQLNPVEALAIFKAALQHSLIYGNHFARSEETKEAYEKIISLVDGNKLKDKELFDESYDSHINALKSVWDKENKTALENLKRLEEIEKLTNNLLAAVEGSQEIKSERAPEIVDLILKINTTSSKDLLKKYSETLKITLTLQNSNNLNKTVEQLTSLKLQSLGLINNPLKKKAALASIAVFDIGATAALEHFGAGHIGSGASHIAKDIVQSTIISSEDGTKALIVKGAKGAISEAEKKIINKTTISDISLKAKGAVAEEFEATPENVFIKSLVAANLVLAFTCPQALIGTVPVLLAAISGKKLKHYHNELSKITDKENAAEFAANTHQEIFYEMIDELLEREIQSREEILEILKLNNLSLEGFDNWKAKNASEFARLAGGKGKSIEMRRLSSPDDKRPRGTSTSRLIQLHRATSPRSDPETPSSPLDDVTTSDDLSSPSSLNSDSEPESPKSKKNRRGKP